MFYYMLEGGEIFTQTVPVTPVLVPSLATLHSLSVTQAHPAQIAYVLFCLSRELLSMQGKLVNYKQTFSETKLL